MPSTLPSSASLSTVDIESIVRKVLDRVKRQQNAEPRRSDNSDAYLISDKVVSVSTIESLPKTVTRVMISAGTIVTPAARDELRLRGLSFEDTSKSVTASNGAGDASRIKVRLLCVDDDHEALLPALSRQVSLRGVDVCPRGAVSAIVSSKPAKTVLDQFFAGRAAVLIQRLADIPRFAREIRPRVFVLDRECLSLTEMTNAVVAISRHALPQMPNGEHQR